MNHLSRRSSGVQLHLTSLPGGRLGSPARAFVDWLAEAGQRWWQMLPLGPPDRYGSPYKSSSAFAAWNGFLEKPGAEVTPEEIDAFRARHAYWASSLPARMLPDQVRFAREWAALRAYASERGVGLIGDVPIYVAPGSYDQKAWPELFLDGVVAGVPPDAFTAAGQRWGNPIYDWPALQRRGYRWWVERFRRTFELYDMARIDHFRGVRRLLGGAGGRPRRARRDVAARAGAGAVCRGDRETRPHPPAAVHRRGPRRHHAAGDAAAARAGLPGHGRPAVRLRPRRPARPAPAGEPRRRRRRLHGDPRHRHAARLVVDAGAGAARRGAQRAARGWAGRRRRRLGPDPPLDALARAAGDAPGPGRPGAGLRSAHEPPGDRRRRLEVRAAARAADGARTPTASAPSPRRPAALADADPPLGTPPERRGTTESRTARSNRPSTAGGAVLALGDSILCGPEEGAFGVPPRSWAQWLAEALDLPFHKLAQPGATTPWIADALLPRARDDYALACVGVGTNDVRSLDWDPRSFAVALERILDGLAARATRVCVATVPLDLGRPRAGAKVAELNAIVRSAAATRETVDCRRSRRPSWLAPALSRRRPPHRARPVGDRSARRRSARAGRLADRPDIRPARHPRGRALRGDAPSRPSVARLAP